MIALLDGNNFYASCERVFQPQLQKKPLIILSNNDGCAISRSEEAKAIGIPMGAPYFTIRHLEHDVGLVALSANFTLYGDMSDRMMNMAAAMGHRQEIYSIDECFIDLSGINGDMTARAKKIRARILQCIGIPTCIGIARTKTLAKLANHIAKNAERHALNYPSELAQVCHFDAVSTVTQNQLLQSTPVRAIWGIGPSLGRQLEQYGIRTALDLSQLPLSTARARWSVVLEKTIRELHGTPCFTLDDQPREKQNIACTRSFGSPVTTLVELQEAITSFTCRAAEKLRQQHSYCEQLMVFIRTSPFRQHDQPYRAYNIRPLITPTSDSAYLTQAALAGLNVIFRQGFRYCKAGVVLLNLRSNTYEQLGLPFEAPSPRPHRAQLMQAVDALNERFGKGTVHLASTSPAGLSRNWAMKQAQRSPCYTTDWQQLAQCT